MESNLYSWTPYRPLNLSSQTTPFQERGNNRQSCSFVLQHGVQEGLRTHNHSCEELMFEVSVVYLPLSTSLFLSFSDDDGDLYECKADGEKFKRLEVHCIGSMTTSFRLLSAHTFDINQSIYHIPWWILIIVLIFLEEFVNHSPAARDLQILLVFYQHTAWFISL